MIETPCVYRIGSDDLYEVDNKAFEFLTRAASPEGALSGNSEFVEFCIQEGILTQNSQPCKRPVIAQSPLPSLRYLELQITDECNLSCKHCYIGASHHIRMDIERISAVLMEFEDMQGLRVLITGGEPTMHPDFLRLNEMLPQFSLRKLLFTNGLLLDSHMLDILNVDEVVISVDGMQNGHETLRGTDTFSRTIKAIEAAIRKGFDTSVSTMIHASNVDEFDQMQQMFIDMGVKDWTVDVAVVAGNLKQHSLLKVSPITGGRLLNYGFGGEIHGGHSEYGCGYHLMSVLADGRAAKCAFYAEQPVGRIEEGLQTCWERVKPIPLAILKCDCDVKLICRGGCRYRAANFGDPLGKDFYRCHANL
ncbi:MAG: radical SAM protein [Nitrospirae bacterium]|nr:radical SAM protein [Nitrospirota bacterium]